jgi:hypothetical protein
MNGGEVLHRPAAVLRSGERAGRGVYRDLTDGREVSVPACGGALPRGPGGPALYVRLDRAPDGPVAGPRGFVGACGRRIVTPDGAGTGRLALVVEPADGRRPGPCTRCRPDCPVITRG